MTLFKTIFDWLCGATERKEAAEAFSKVMTKDTPIYTDWPEGKGDEVYDFWTPALEQHWSGHRLNRDVLQ